MWCRFGEMDWKRKAKAAKAEWEAANGVGGVGAGGAKAAPQGAVMGGGAAAAPPRGGDLLSQIAAGSQARPSGAAALSSIDALLSQNRAAAAVGKPQATGPDQYGKPVDGRWVNAKVPPALDMFQEMAWKRRQKEAQAAWEAASQ